MYVKKITSFCHVLKEMRNGAEAMLLARQLDAYSSAPFIPFHYITV